MTATNRPNILLIMCDQLRADALGCYGSSFVRTPNIDRLAQWGVTFDRAYSRTPVCVPARYGLLSGQAPFRIGLIDNGAKRKDFADPLPELLKKQGYAAFAVGKMHFSPVRSHYGFDRMLLSEEVPGHFSDDDYLRFLRDNGWLHVVEPHGKRSETYYAPQTSELPEQMHSTAWTAARACELIRENRNRPFFLFASFIKPHPPFDPCRPYDTMYPPERVPMPVRDEAERRPIDLAIDVQNDYKVNGIHRVTDDQLRRIRAAYYGSVSQVDRQIGAILDTLDGLGLSENTLILFTADHGEHLGDHYAFGKRTYYEPSARIPLIVSQPGTLPQGERRSAFATLEDLYATAVAAAGGEVPAGSDGMSLLPLAHDAALPGRSEMYGEFGLGRMLKFMRRWDRYKYVYHTNGGREALFDLAADPSELHDISTGHPGLCRESRAKLADYYHSFDFADALGDDGVSLKQYPYEPHRPRGYLNQFPRWQSTVFED